MPGTCRAPRAVRGGAEARPRRLPPDADRLRRPAAQVGPHRRRGPHVPQGGGRGPGRSRVEADPARRPSESCWPPRIKGARGGKPLVGSPPRSRPTGPAPQSCASRRLGPARCARSGVVIAIWRLAAQLHSKWLAAGLAIGQCSPAVNMDNLDQLEQQSVYIFREAFRHFERLCMLWSIGKDSTVLLWLARKAFFGHVPFPLVHIDTSYKLPGDDRLSRSPGDGVQAADGGGAGRRRHSRRANLPGDAAPARWRSRQADARAIAAAT